MTDTADQMPDELWLEPTDTLEDCIYSIEYTSEQPGTVKYIRADLAPHQQPGAGGELSSWYCPTCKREVPPQQVTYSEHHESCGTYIGASTAPQANAGGDAERAEAFKRNMPSNEWLKRRIESEPDLECEVGSSALTSQPDTDNGLLGYANLGDAESDTHLVTLKELDDRSPDEYFGHRRHIPVYVKLPARAQPDVRGTPITTEQLKSGQIFSSKRPVNEPDVRGVMEAGDDSTPCVSCGKPGDTSTDDGAEMCWECHSDFMCCEYGEAMKAIRDLADDVSHWKRKFDESRQTIHTDHGTSLRKHAAIIEAARSGGRDE